MTGNPAESPRIASDVKPGTDGITIGANAMVGAGSAVTRDVPPDTTVAGNPARVIQPSNKDFE